MESIEEDINNVLQDNNPETQRIVEIMDNPDGRIAERRRMTSYEEIQSTEGTKVISMINLAFELLLLFLKFILKKGHDLLH